MTEFFHLPFDDLAPFQERPILTCPCDEAMARDVNEFTSAFYKNQVLSLELYVAWLQKNPFLLVCLCDRLRQVQGYFDVFPFEPGFMDQFIAGTQTELDIREEHILTPDKALNSQRLYLGGVAVRDPNKFFQKRCASFLIWGILQYILHYYGIGIERDIFALAFTPEGEKLLRAFRFQIACGASKRLDGHNLYVYHLNPNNLKEFAANVPDWKGHCEVAFQGGYKEGQPVRKDPLSLVRGNRTGRGKRINALMLEKLVRNPESLNWSISQWMTVLGCAKSTIAETSTWKDRIRPAQIVARADREVREGRKASRSDDD